MRTTVEISARQHRVLSALAQQRGRGRGRGARLTRRLVIERRLRVTAITGFELRVGADFLARNRSDAT